MVNWSGVVAALVAFVASNVVGSMKVARLKADPSIVKADPHVNPIFNLSDLHIVQVADDLPERLECNTLTGYADLNDYTLRPRRRSA